MAPAVGWVEWGLEGGDLVPELRQPLLESRDRLLQGGNLIEDLGDDPQKRLDHQQGETRKRRHTWNLTTVRQTARIP